MRPLPESGRVRHALFDVLAAVPVADYCERSGVSEDLVRAAALRIGQVRTARESFGSVCLFAYSALFDSPNEAIDSQTAEVRAERRARRDVFVPFLQGLAR